MVETLYDCIYEIKQDLKSNQQIRVEINSVNGCVIRKADKICCIGGNLIVVRLGLESIIPLDKIIRVRREYQ